MTDDSEAASSPERRPPRALMSVVPTSDVISFARGVPSPDTFPVAELLESSQHAILEDGRTALNYGEAFGYIPLRRMLADQHRVAPEQVVVMPGSLVGLNFLVAHFFPHGQRALVEAPTYDRMLGLLTGVGADVGVIPRREDGLDLDALRTALRQGPHPQFFYVLPTFHNPTGHTLTLEERHELVGLALENELPLLEDDPYGQLRVEGEPLPRLHDLLVEQGGERLALFSSTFSKTIAPGVRVGYLVLPQALVAPIEALVTRAYVSPPLLAQAVVHRFVSGGYFEPHIDRLRAALRTRRDALLEVLDDELAGVATWTRPHGGYFVWLRLPRTLAANELSQRARGDGVEIVPGDGFALEAESRSCARLAYSYPPVDAIREGARRLSSLVLAST